MRLGRLAWIGFGATSAIGSPLAAQDVRSGGTDHQKSHTPGSGNIKVNRQGLGGPVEWGLGLAALGATGIGSFLAGRLSKRPQIEQMTTDHRMSMGNMRDALDRAQETIVESGRQNSQLHQQIQALERDLELRRQGQWTEPPDKVYTQVQGVRMNILEYADYLTYTASCYSGRHYLIRSLPVDDWQRVLEYLDQAWPVQQSALDGLMVLASKVEAECKMEYLDWVTRGRPKEGKQVHPIWREVEAIADREWRRQHAPYGMPNVEEGRRQEDTEGNGNGNINPMAFDVGGAKTWLANVPQSARRWSSEMQKQAPGMVMAAARNGRMALQNVPRPVKLAGAG